MANESKVILAEERRYLHHVMEMKAGNATIKGVLLVLLCVIKNSSKHHPPLSICVLPTHPRGAATVPDKFPRETPVQDTGTHTCAFTQPNSNSFTGTNPKELYGSQLNHPSFLGKTEKTLARQIKLEMGQSQTPRSKPTQNSQCIWIQVQILTLCYCFSLCNLPGQQKLLRLSPGITWCYFITTLHQGSASKCSSCGCLAHFCPRPSLTSADP